jgi:hypothetical protein
VLPVFGGGRKPSAAVYVEDVAEAIANILAEHRVPAGSTRSAVPYPGRFPGSQDPGASFELLPRKLLTVGPS